MSGISYQANFKKKGQDVLGTVLIKSGRLYFIPAGSQKPTLSLDEFSIDPRMDDKYVYIHNLIDLDEVIVIRKTKDLIGYLESEIKVEIKKPKSFFEKSHEFTKIVVVFIAIGAIVLGVHTFIRYNSELIVSFISHEYEEKLGTEYLTEGFSSTLYPETSDAVLQLNELASLVLNRVDTSPYEPKILLCINDQANAFNLPGGIIVFNSALIQKAETPEEILGILSHELGHMTMRHTMKSYVQSVTSNIFTLLLNGKFNLIETLDGALGRQFSQQDETDADEFGSQVLSDLNISTRGMADFFTRDKDSLLNSKYLGWLSTHPSNEKREEFFQKLAREQQNIKPIEFDLKKLKQALKIDAPIKN